MGPLLPLRHVGKLKEGKNRGKFGGIKREVERVYSWWAVHSCDIRNSASWWEDAGRTEGSTSIGQPLRRQPLQRQEDSQADRRPGCRRRGPLAPAASAFAAGSVDTCLPFSTAVTASLSSRAPGHASGATKQGGQLRAVGLPRRRRAWTVPTGRRQGPGAGAELARRARGGSRARGGAAEASHLGAEASHLGAEGGLVISGLLKDRDLRENL